MRTIVVHCKKEPYDVLIDRTTKWGNPFRIQKGCTHQSSLKKFKEWFPKQKHLMESLHEIQGKRIGCWCKPKDCHGDILADFADKQAGVIF